MKEWKVILIYLVSEVQKKNCELQVLFDSEKSIKIAKKMYT